MPDEDVLYEQACDDVTTPNPFHAPHVWHGADGISADIEAHLASECPDLEEETP